MSLSMSFKRVTLSHVAVQLAENSRPVAQQCTSKTAIIHCRKCCLYVTSVSLMGWVGVCGRASGKCDGAWPATGTRQQQCHILLTVCGTAGQRAVEWQRGGRWSVMMMHGWMLDCFRRWLYDVTATNIDLVWRCSTDTLLMTTACLTWSSARCAGSPCT